MELVRRWIAGWRLCRGLEPPVEYAEATFAQINAPSRERELFASSADYVERLAPLATETTWLTVTTTAQDAAAVAEQFSAVGLQPFDELKTLMTRPLAGHPVATAPPAYDVLVVDEGPLIYVHVHAADGSIAAHGMAAVVGTDVVMHDIETEATHRRRGLGRVVMGALVQRGVERGAEHGLLMATEVGTHLYRALGWSTEAILVTATGPTPARAELTETLSSI